MQFTYFILFLQVKARNPKGESDFSKKYVLLFYKFITIIHIRLHNILLVLVLLFYSDSLTATTRIDLSKIPDPLDVKFEPKSRTLVFNVLAPLPMATAKVSKIYITLSLKVYFDISNFSPFAFSFMMNLNKVSSRYTN